MRVRKGVLLAAAIVVALLVAAGVGYAWYQRSRAAERKAAADQAMSETRIVFGDIEDEFDKLDVLWLSVETPAEDDFAAALDAYAVAATPAMEAGRAELDRLDVTVGALPDSAFKEALADAVEEMRRALDAGEHAAVVGADLAGFLRAIDQVSAVLDDATEVLNGAIDKSNEDDYNGATEDAKEAKAHYMNALEMLEAAAAAYPDADASSLVDIVKTDIDRADVALRAIEFARDGEIDHYDERVQRFLALSEEIDGAELPPWIDDPTLLFEKMRAARQEVGEHVLAAEGSRSLAASRIEAREY